MFYHILSHSLWHQFYPTKRKLIYCSRTVPEIEKALAELKRLMAYRIACAETEEEKQKEQDDNVQPMTPEELFRMRMEILPQLQ